MALIRRTLLLKKVAQIDGKRYPPVPQLDLHVHLNQLFQTAQSVWDRHYPARDKVKQGQRCVFFERVERKGQAVLFHAYSYIAGLTPDQAVFDEIKAKISADPLVDAEGKPKEVVERFAVLAMGEALIIESARVAGSGPLAVHAMRDLIRRYVAKNFPNLRLEDAPSLDFKQMAKIHHGVKEVTVRLHSGFVAEPNTFGHSLESFIEPKGFGPVKRVVTTIEAMDGQELDVDEVESLVNESEHGTGLSGVTVTFKDGVSLGDLDKYREKLGIEVQQVRPGVPAVTEIETAMVDYLKALMKPDDANFQLINNTGNFT
ncbi:MAG TPA: hypothetical protein VFL96_07080 [Acidobacteriaceae bacterium]|nr:hypothetical protein [Acidobacteriaceae bacterium]